MTYEDYLTSDEWHQRAREAKQRAGWRCAVCNSRKPVEAHHRTYQRLGCERNSDIVVLCSRCHKLFHGVLEDSRQAMLPFLSRTPYGHELN